MRSAEKLFDLLHDSNASMLTVIPRDDAGQPMGVVVIVHENLTQEFLAHLEEFNAGQRPVQAEDEEFWDE